MLSFPEKIKNMFKLSESWAKSLKKNSNFSEKFPFFLTVGVQAKSLNMILFFSEKLKKKKIKCLQQLKKLLKCPRKKLKTLLNCWDPGQKNKIFLKGSRKVLKNTFKLVGSGPKV